MKDTTTTNLMFLRPRPQGTLPPSGSRDAVWTDDYGWLVPVKADYKKHELTEDWTDTAALRELLGELLSYAPDYFVEKWKLDQQVVMWMEALE